MEEGSVDLIAEDCEGVLFRDFDNVFELGARCYGSGWVLGVAGGRKCELYLFRIARNWWGLLTLG